MRESRETVYPTGELVDVLLKLLALFVVVPLVELWLLLLLADHTFPLFALGVVIVTGVAGTLLARPQGWKTLGLIRRDLSVGKLPTDALLDAALILCAGALLLTPGMLTDALGLSLLTPLCRRWYRTRLLRWIRRNFQIQTVHARGETGPGQSRIIDAHVVQRPPVVETPSDRVDPPASS